MRCRLVAGTFCAYRLCTGTCIRGIPYLATCILPTAAAFSAEYIAFIG